MAVADIDIVGECAFVAGGDVDLGIMALVNGGGNRKVRIGRDGGLDRGGHIGKRIAGRDADGQASAATVETDCPGSRPRCRR